jgi:hypothetical protein
LDLVDCYHRHTVWHVRDDFFDGADRDCRNGLSVMAGQIARTVACVSARRIDDERLTRQADMIESAQEFFGFAAEHAAADYFDAAAIG